MAWAPIPLSIAEELPEGFFVGPGVLLVDETVDVRRHCSTDDTECQPTVVNLSQSERLVHIPTARRLRLRRDTGTLHQGPLPMLGTLA